MKMLTVICRNLVKKMVIGESCFNKFFITFNLKFNNKLLTSYGMNMTVSKKQ